MRLCNAGGKPLGPCYQRALLLLADGRSDKAIAFEMDVSISTAKQYIRRGRACLGPVVSMMTRSELAIFIRDLAHNCRTDERRSELNCRIGTVRVKPA